MYKRNNNEGMLLLNSLETVALLRGCSATPKKSKTNLEAIRSCSEAPASRRPAPRWCLHLGGLLFLTFLMTSCEYLWIELRGACTLRLGAHVLAFETHGSTTIWLTESVDYNVQISKQLRSICQHIIHIWHAAKQLSRVDVTMKPESDHLSRQNKVELMNTSAEEITSFYPGKKGYYANRYTGHTCTAGITCKRQPKP